MKLKWKIGIGILLLFTILVPVYFLTDSLLTPPSSAPPLPQPPEKSVPPLPHPPETSARPQSLPPDWLPPPGNRPLEEMKFGIVDRLLEEMKFGIIAFNAPTKISMGDSPQIQLILSLSEAMDELKQALTEEGEKIGAPIRISDRMEARLSGYMFQITAITPEIQAVSKIQRTEWKWEIHPKEEGQHKLHLTLTALLKIDGYSTPRAIRTFSKNIEVNVTATQKIWIFFKSNWQWLWAAVLVPVAGWLWRRKKKQITEQGEM